MLFQNLYAVIFSKKLSLKFSLLHHYFSKLQNSIIDTHTAVQRCYCLSCSVFLQDLQLQSCMSASENPQPADPRSLASPHSKRCFLSLSVVSIFISSPFLCSLVLSSLRSSLQFVCLSALSLLLAFCGRCGLSLKPRPWMCQWLRPPTQQSSASTRCPLSPRPAPAMTCDPGGLRGPLRTMPGYFVLGGGCSVLETPGSSCTWKPGNIRNFKLT